MVNFRQRFPERIRSIDRLSLRQDYLNSSLSDLDVAVAYHHKDHVIYTHIPSPNIKHPSQQFSMSKSLHHVFGGGVEY